MQSQEAAEAAKGRPSAVCPRAAVGKRSKQHHASLPLLFFVAAWHNKAARALEGLEAEQQGDQWNGLHDARPALRTLRGGSSKPRLCMNGTASITEPWNTMVPSFISMTSSKSAYVSGGGCSSEMRAV